MIDDLQQLLDAHGIQHFKATEIVHPRKGEPPADLWPRILLTLELADEIREILGAPVRVISGYRSPEYNRKVGGAAKSEHVEFRALDLTWSGPMSQLWMVASEVMDHAHARGIRTGRGLYDTFVHIDTGSTKGTIRRWDERTK